LSVAIALIDIAIFKGARYGNPAAVVKKGENPGKGPNAARNAGSDAQRAALGERDKRFLIKEAEMVA
jgi:hypothetical protein